MFAYRHIPVLVVAFLNTVGGMWPLITPRPAMLEYGLPESIANQPATHPVMGIGGGRSAAIGMMIFALYAQGDLAAVDVVLAIMGFVLGVVDLVVCYKAGVPGRGWFRLSAGVVIGMWGAFGITKGSS
ncbi:hypothetical protein K4F52_006695 [Lecanicillium sp. MT-2017a]|nr:hypothetical protein K4F52_006695 [Lecanicillium sp. MT-2017a]